MLDSNYLPNRNVTLRQNKLLPDFGLVGGSCTEGDLKILPTNCVNI